ncbi:DUF998 domain-containing protein [Streptomyces sp. PvR034]|uniref:DUF998 domain-containing protein n=1 Tax=Streptomyces sp. PvR034 TaxID=3156401 RepID=UPI0033922020
MQRDSNAAGPAPGRVRHARKACHDRHDQRLRHRPRLRFHHCGVRLLGAGIALGLAREGFDFTRNAISQLSLGDLGWIQIANFFVAGALLIAGAVGMRRSVSEGPGHRAAPWLVGVFGASFLVLSRRFTAEGQPGWASACRLLPVGVLAGFVGSGASVLSFTAGAALGLAGLAAVTARLARH